jgi:hypothetical protein
MTDTTDYSMADHAAVEEAAAELRAELDRLHSWAGLMELLDEHWPADVFSPEAAQNETADPGVRIVALLRWVDKLQRELAVIQDAEFSRSQRLEEDVRRLTAERDTARDELATRLHLCVDVHLREISRLSAKLQRVLALAERYENADADYQRDNGGWHAVAPYEQFGRDLRTAVDTHTDTPPGPVVICGSTSQQEDLAGVASMYNPGLREVLWPETSDRPAEELNREWLAAIESAALVVIVRKRDRSLGATTVDEWHHALVKGRPYHLFEPATPGAVITEGAS